MKHICWVVVGAALLAIGACAGKPRKDDPLATTALESKRVPFTGSRIPREVNRERNRAPGGSSVQVMEGSEGTDRIGVISGPGR